MGVVSGVLLDLWGFWGLPCATLQTLSRFALWPCHTLKDVVELVANNLKPSFKGCGPSAGGRGVLTACKIFLPALVANLRGDAWPPTTSSSAAWLFVGTWVQTLRQNCFEDIGIAAFVVTNPL